MLRWLSTSSVRNRRALLAVVVLLTATAAWQVSHIKHDVLPEFVPPTVEVQTEALGLSAEEMEQLITVPLERDFLNGVPFVTDVSSTSVPGLSSVVLTFKRGTSIFTARQLVQERLSLTTELPRVSKPPQMLEAVASASRVEMIGLRSTTVSAIDMSVLAQFTIKPKLLGVPGVANIAIFGERDLQLQVQVDPAKMAAHGVMLDQVVSTAGNALFVSPLPYLEASTPGAGGYFDTANQRLGVQHNLPITSAAELAKVVVDGAAANVTLGDVSNVVEDHQPLIGDAVVDGGPGLFLVVQKLPGADTTTVTKAVDGALDSLRPGLSGISIDTSVYRPASYVNLAVHNLTLATLAAAGLGLLVVLLVLLDLRAAAVTVLTVPLSAIATAYVLYLRGTDLTALEFAGIAAGTAIAVHDAITVSDAVARLRRAHPDGTELDSPAAAVAAATEIGLPISVAALVALVCLLPVLAMAGLPSRPFLPPVAVTFALATAISAVVALTVAPAAGALFARIGPSAKRLPGRATDAVGRAFHRVVTPVFERPALAVGVAAVVLVGVGGLGATQIQASLTPSLHETDLLVQWDAAPGTSLGEVDRLVTRASAELRTVKGVRDVGSHIGRAITSDQLGGVDSAETWISVDPNADHASVVDRINNVIDGYPGISHLLLSYFNDQVSNASEEAPIIVRVYGQDLGVLQTKGEQIRKLLAGTRGVVDARVDSPPQEPTIQVNVDLAKADAFGVKPGDVRREATTLISGLTVGALYQDQKVFEVVVKGAPEAAQSLAAVADLRIDGANGQIRLGEVASVTIGPTPTAIQHDNISRSLDVTAAIRGRNGEHVLRDVRREVKGVVFPAEHNAVVISDIGPHRSAQLRVLVFAVLAVALSFLMLQALFDSWATATVAAAAVPLALSGGAVAIWAAGGTLSIGSVAGLAVIGALTVREGCLILDRCRQPAVEHRPSSAVTAGQAVKDRALAVIGTAVGLALGAVPVVVLDQRPGAEVLRPMAFVLWGGLLSWVVVTLVAVPAAFALLASRGHSTETTEVPNQNLPEEIPA